MRHRQEVQEVPRKLIFHFPFNAHFRHYRGSHQSRLCDTISTMQVRSRNTPLILLITLGFLEIACSKKLPDDVHLRTALNNWVIVLNRDTPLNGYGEKAVFTLEVSGPVAPVMAGDENTIKY